MSEEALVTLSYVAQNPDLFTHILSLPSGEQFIFRPLRKNDTNNLTQFLEGLSVETRKFSTFSSYDVVTAKEFCETINKYDKLRFVLETTSGNIAGLFELSFGIPKSDMERFKEHGISLNEHTDCRFGPTLADNYQQKGLGSLIMPYITGIARKFGKKRITLYGGVLVDNTRAISFYEKYEFHKVGKFNNSDNNQVMDMLLNLQ